MLGEAGGHAIEIMSVSDLDVKVASWEVKRIGVRSYEIICSITLLLFSTSHRHVHTHTHIYSQIPEHWFVYSYKYTFGIRSLWFIFCLMEYIGRMDSIHITQEMGVTKHLMFLNRSRNGTSIDPLSVAYIQCVCITYEVTALRFSHPYTCN